MDTTYPVVQPYLFFDGRCEEALEFYKKALGAKVLMLFRFKESPVPAETAPGQPPPDGEKIMHARMVIGNSVVMVSDGRCAGRPAFEGFSLSVAVASEADVDRYFNPLADGGKVVMPLEKTFFSPRFGMVVDKFGVTWMIIVEPHRS
jgi:PhnB protein